MSNAIGLNVQTAPSVESAQVAAHVVPQVVPVDILSATKNCSNGDCSSLNNDFLELLNSEINALVDVGSQGAELQGVDSPDLKVLDFGALSDEQVLDNVEEVDDLSNLELSNAVLANLIQGDEVLTDSSSLDDTASIGGLDIDAKKLEAAVTDALSELPEDVIGLPPTPENMATMTQQVLALVEKNNPELIAQIQQKNGQVLPLEGTLLPLIEEKLMKQDSIKAASIISMTGDSIDSDFANKELGFEIGAEKTPLELLSKKDSDSDTKFENSFKKVFEQSDKKSNVINDKASLPLDKQTQKVTTEALSTAFNNVLGTNQASINTPTAAAVQSGTTLQLPQNPSPDQWGSALGDKVQWMINAKLDSAEIRIDPPSLGKMDISIKMTDDGASISIQTQHAATRELVDAASYRLREMLGQAGYNNVNVDVSHRESNQSDNQFSQNNEFNNQSSSYDENEQTELTNNHIIAGTLSDARAGLDLFV